MAGLAVLFQQNSEPPAELVFRQFCSRVAQSKHLSHSAAVIDGEGCRAAKFNTAASLHRAVAHDPVSGSWLLASGTVVDPKDPAPDGDLSTLLQDYLAQGEAVFARLDGVFALALYDGRTRSLLIVSDPFGYLSVFYGERDNHAWIATSALAVAQQTLATPSEFGVQCFLRTGKVFGSQTLWQQVKRLPAATVLRFTRHGTSESVYWVPSLDPAVSRLSLPEAVDAAAEVLPALLKRNLAREGKMWSDLTGGFDTRLLTMLLERAGLPFKANFVGPDEHPDVQIARQIVAHTGWEHQHFELPPTWADDAPNYLAEALSRGDGHLNVLLLLRPLWVHHQEQDQFRTLLSGLGGEMWRGPNWWSERAAIGRSTTVHWERQLWSLMHPIPEQVLVSDSRARVGDELVRQFQAVGERCPDAPNTFKLDSMYTFRETAHAGAWSSFAAGLLRVLPALFSKDITTFAMSMDYGWRVTNALVKHLFSRYRPVLANLEVEGRGPAAPLRLDNWYRFIPSRLVYARRAIDKLSQVALGRSLWRTTRPVSYSRLAWRRALLQAVVNQGLLDPGRMHSGELYRPEPFKSFLAQAETDHFTEEEFLGRILTVEMASRAADTWSLPDPSQEVETQIVLTQTQSS